MKKKKKKFKNLVYKVQYNFIELPVDDSVWIVDYLSTCREEFLKSK